MDARRRVRGAVAERLSKLELPPEAAVFDFGTPAELAYEAMRAAMTP